jgi:predicted ATPase
MGGSVTDEKDIFGNKELSFKRASDNLTIKLEQMATGIKSFAYLDRLLENGYLTQGNILILDEPEAHLHPQWIVEFARMLVKIHKETGLFIMLASHDPDMVSAIRYIAEKEDVLDDTTFYLAEQDKNAETFSYKELGHDIEPIFASFNKSFDLIEKYGVDNGR